jgi:hypothetical protein
MRFTLFKVAQRSFVGERGRRRLLLVRELLAALALKIPERVPGGLRALLPQHLDKGGGMHSRSISSGPFDAKGPSMLQ